MSNHDGASERTGRPTDPTGGGEDGHDTDEASEVVASAYFDPTRGAGLGTTIVRVVAEAKGVPPESLDGPPLYHRVDPHFLEKALFTPRSDGSRRTVAGFSYHGYRVRVRGDGYVCAVDPDAT